MIYLGEPTSTKGEEVQVEVNFRRMDFIDFDEDEMTLSVMEGITTNEDTGIYTVIVKISEKNDNISEKYKIKITITEADPIIECEENE